DHRQIPERSDFDAIAARNLLHMRSASPSWLPIDHHRARAAHADPARITIGQRRIDVLLDPDNDVENRLAFLVGDLKALEFSAGAISSPDRYVEDLGVQGQALSPHASF